MRKQDEAFLPSSCFSKAEWGEMIFVLRGKDPDAPGTIRDWVARRIASGKNKIDDPKIVEALESAKVMERDRHLYETR